MGEPGGLRFWRWSVKFAAARFGSKKGALLVALGLVLFAAGAQGDVVTLKNGDRVTGTLVSVKSAHLELKSDALGNLIIPLDKVAAFSAEKPVAVIVKGQTPLRGQLQLQPSGDWQVTVNGKPETVKAASVDLIIPAEDYEKLIAHKGKPWQDWRGTASLGYSIQRGDQRTNTFSTTVAAVRERPETPTFEPHWRTNFGLTTLLSNASQSGTTVTSNTLSTSLRQDYLFSPDNFVFGTVEFDHVGAQGLYLRQTYGGGYGRDVIKSKRTLFSVLGGFTFVHEKFFTGAYDQSGEALIGETLGIQLTKWLRLDHDINFYPDVTNTGQYRFDTATAFSAKISNKFSLNTGVIDLYLSNPAAGSRNNNLAFTTGIGYTF
jgi:putative salt-induced outer membrane protein YdiY